MPKKFSLELAGRAEKLYCLQGYGFGEIEALTGISLRTLKSWSARCGWVEKRRENSRSIQEIRSNTLLLREKLSEHCSKTLSAQEVLALVALESLARKTTLDEAKKASDSPIGALGKHGGVKKAIGALEKAFLIRMNQLQADPELLDLQAVKGLEAAFDLVDRLRTRLRRSAELKPAYDLLARVEPDIVREILEKMIYTPNPSRDL